MQFPACIAGLLVCTAAPNQAFAESFTSEAWHGQLVVDSYDCRDRSSDRIVIEETVTVIPRGEESSIKCPAIIFKTGGRLKVEGSLLLQVDRLSGPLSIVAGNGLPQHEQPSSPSAGGSANGRRGAAGQAAPPAPRLPFKRFPLTARVGGMGLKGGRGVGGRPGANGKEGLAGQKGPSVTLILDWIEPGSSIEVQTVGQAGGRGGAGGDGGRGGTGGNGGNGGSGSQGNSVFLPGAGGKGGQGGCGGKGGVGGYGGQGGRGGAGGDITLRFTENSFLLDHDVPLKLNSTGGAGGRGGNGGLAGIPGAGGHGGAGGAGGISHSSVPDGKRGARGRQGYRGSAGHSLPQASDGAAGQIGIISWGQGSLDLNELLARLAR